MLGEDSEQGIEWLAGLSDTPTQNPTSEPATCAPARAETESEPDVLDIIGTAEQKTHLTNLDARRRKQLNKMKRLFDKTLDEIDDRLRGGDWVIDKEGVLRRQPVRAADLVKVANSLANQVNLLEGRATAIVGADARLESLALKLRALADPGTSARIIEGERVEEGEE